MNDSITRTALGCKRILVVEDTQSVAEFISEMLQAFGHTGDIALSVSDALALYAPAKYDLVITDYTMPSMNGIDFARLIKQQDAGQTILLITGSNFSLSDKAPGEMPIEAVLQKPFSVTEFQDMLSLLLAAKPACQSPGLSAELSSLEPIRPASRDLQIPIQASLRGFDAPSQT